MTPQPDIANGRILVRGVNWLGDAVMTTPALLRLREKFPAAHISLLTPEKLADLWRGHPAVDEVIPFSAGESVLGVSRRLRASGFTHALVLPNSPRSALEVWLAGIPRRIGYARAWRNGLLTQAVSPRPEAVKMRKRTTAEIERLTASPPPGIFREKRKAESGNPPSLKLRSTGAETPDPAARAHQIHEYLHLVAALGANPAALAPRVRAPLSADMVLARFLRADAPRAAAFIGLNPGAEYGPAKRWPVESFAAAARELYGRLDCEFLIFGGPGDVALARQLRRLLPVPLARGHVTCLAGQTGLGELMAALQACRVLITNDTGPMHVAAALGVPVVVPFGSTAPDLTGPGLPGDPRHQLLRSDAPCAPCFRRECPIDFRCLRDISVERVVAAVLRGF